MSVTRGKRTFFAVFGLGIVVVALAVGIGSERLLELWHLWRLQSTHEPTAIAAAQRLGEVGDEEAARQLLSLALARRAEGAERDALAEAARGALVSLGSVATPALVDALSSGEPESRLRTLRIVEEMGRADGAVVHAVLDGSRIAEKGPFRQAALRFAGRFPFDSSGFVVAASALLEIGDLVLRRRAVETLFRNPCGRGLARSDATSLARVLRRSYAEGGMATRFSVLFGVQQLELGGPEAFLLLADALGGSTEALRRRALWLLERRNPDAAERDACLAALSSLETKEAELARALLEGRLPKAERTRIQRSARSPIRGSLPVRVKPRRTSLRAPSGS